MVKEHLIALELGNKEGKMYRFHNRLQSVYINAINSAADTDMVCIILEPI